MNFHDSDVVTCVAVFHRVPGFCVIFHARLHRKYTGISTAPRIGKGLPARRGGDLSFWLEKSELATLRFCETDFIRNRAAHQGPSPPAAD